MHVNLSPVVEFFHFVDELIDRLLLSRVINQMIDRSSNDGIPKPLVLHVPGVHISDGSGFISVPCQPGVMDLLGAFGICGDVTMGVPHRVRDYYCSVQDGAGALLHHAVLQLRKMVGQLRTALVQIPNLLQYLLPPLHLLTEQVSLICNKQYDQSKNRKKVRQLFFYLVRVLIPRNKQRDYYYDRGKHKRYHVAAR